jgi:hypothetical protein
MGESSGNTPMPSPPPDRARRSLNHWQENVLRYGPQDRWDDAFPDAAAVQEAWEYHRQRILPGYRHGHRPWAWWEFDAPPGLDYDYDREQSTLYEAGLLGEEEKAELLAWWRKQYDHAWSAHFFHCDGPGKIFEGPVGRRKHFKWADIPRGLLREWNAERRRRGKVIRKLKAAASQSVLA